MSLAPRLVPMDPGQYMAAQPPLVNGSAANGLVPAHHALAPDDPHVNGPDTEPDSHPLVATDHLRHGALVPRAPDNPQLPINYITFYTHRRHRTDGLPRVRDPRDAPDWRMKDRLRTIVASLTLCLNLGVDPPDANRTQPSANMLCWHDPSELDSSRALNVIGRALQAQFETLSTRTRYKVFTDPIVEDMKRNCANQRRVAKDERVLFYYNGYGVPRPTPGGEIWVFNRSYTQYIPVTLAELQTSLGSPCIYVWDANNSGNIVNHSRRLQERRAAAAAAAAATQSDKNQEGSSSSTPTGTGGTGGMAGRASASASASASANGATPSNNNPEGFPVRESIHLAACAADETLPTAPELPADLFTCCLTSPIELSLRIYMLQNRRCKTEELKMIMGIPGKLQDRRTPLGELNWIFTSITDTIAWSTFPRPLFRRLFRDDLLVAALMRNFLLAERVMRLYHCTPCSNPPLPETHNHRMWADWDMALDQMVQQLPQLVARARAEEAFATAGTPIAPELEAVEHKSSSFFTDQLSAFDVWIRQAGASRKPHNRRPVDDSGAQVDTYEYEDDVGEPVREPPEQLPIVLQVLLSQVHRVRALILLSSFLDLGPWAVNQALSIGIFPYVLKLLQSPALDLKPVLIYIWARILAVDRSCQYDLLRDDGYKYFSNALSPFYAQPGTTLHPTTAGFWGGPDFPHASEHRAMCAFILSVFCYDYPPGQSMCLQGADVLPSCIEHLDDDDFLLRQWAALCLARLWDSSELGKAQAVRVDAHGKLVSMLADPAPEVRSAVLYALGTLLGTRTPTDDIPSTPTSHSLATRAAAGQPTTPGAVSAAARPLVLGTGTSTNLPEAFQRDMEVGLVVAILSCRSDPSPLVRRELLIAISPLVREYTGWFVLAMYLYIAGLSTHDFPTDDDSDGFVRAVWDALGTLTTFDAMDIDNLSAFQSIYTALLDLSVDPFPDIATLASIQVDYISAHLFSSDVPLAEGSVALDLMPPEFLARYWPKDRTSSNDPHEKDTDYFAADAPHAQRSQHAQQHEDGNQNVPSTPGAWARGGLSTAARALRLGFTSRPASPAASPPASTTSATASATASAGSVNRHLSELSISSPSSVPTGRTSPEEPVPKLRKPMPPGGGVSVPQLWQPSTDSATRTPQQSVRQARQVDVADALAELIARDLRRFRGRGMPVPPSNVNFAASGGTGNMKVGADVLPLTSRLYGWAAEMYTQPQMKDPEPTEPGSVASNIQAYKQYRNDRIVQQAKAEVPEASTTPWSGELKSLRNSAPAHHMAFHQFEDHLAVASGEDTVSIWDWRRGQLLNEFSNGNPSKTYVTALKFLNEAADADLLVTGSSDGDVRIFRHYDRMLPAPLPSESNDDQLRNSACRPTELLAAFRAIPDALPSLHPVGMQLDWVQLTGFLLAAGDSPVVRVWDAHRETCVCDVPTHMNTSVTALSSEKDNSDLFFVGGQDGSVRAFDRRNPPASSMVRLWEEHRTPLKGLHMQSFGNRELVSCAADGSVRLWDLRMDASVHQLGLNPSLRSSVTSFALHNRAPLMAALSKPRTNPIGRSGTLISRLSLCTLDPLEPLGQPLSYLTWPVPGTTGTNSPLRTTGDARRAMAELSLGRTRDMMGVDAFAPDPRSVRYTPPLGSVAMHPQLHLVAYAGPSRTTKLNTPPLRARSEVGKGWDEQVYTPKPLHELIVPGSTQRGNAPRGSWIW